MSYLPYDVLALIAGGALIFGGALYFGKSATISVILSLIVSTLFYQNLPHTDELFFVSRGTTTDFLIEVGIFSVLALFSYFVIRRAVANVYPRNPFVRSIEAALLSFIILGLIFFTLTKTFSFTQIEALFPSLQIIAQIQDIYFWWLLGSFLSLVVILRR